MTTMVIDLLEAADRSRAKEVWQTVSGFLSQQPGFREAQLVETFKTLMPRTDYGLASVCRWDSSADWDGARAAAKSSPEIVARLANSGTLFTSMKADLVDGREYAFREVSPRMVLLDVIYLEPEQVDGYAAMWSEANNYMGGLPGFVNASLYRNATQTPPSNSSI